MVFVHTRIVSVITFGFAGGITLFPFILLLPGSDSPRVRQHELIHIRQQLEVLLVCLPLLGVGAWWHSPWWLLGVVVQPYYLWYGLEYLVRLAIARDTLRAYYDISLEQEAYAYHQEPDYLLYRRPFAWLRFLRKRYPWPF